MKALFAQFSAPGGVPSHCAPEIPGSFHEGGELGYSLLHAYGAALDNPALTVFCVIGDGDGDGEAEPAPWRAAGMQQVPQSGPRRRGAADPGVERIQGRQPGHSRPYPRGGLAAANARRQLRAADRRR
ncbi:hypothetical protein [Jidongwangia harbinensis]|uniref:hypothetical protein n=1 Tax=Jidongwangia harbinensis TaxID=2878561 RepID=UPI0021065A55|nr:hypothetical protein [Jidongwangia harbinensis]